MRADDLDPESIQKHGISASRAEIEFLDEANRKRALVAYDKLRPALVEALGDRFVGTGWSNAAGVRIFHLPGLGADRLTRGETSGTSWCRRHLRIIRCWRSLDGSDGEYGDRQSA